MPGFRPGKAPRPLLERALGIRRDDPALPTRIYDDAKEHLFERSVLEAAREQDLDLLAVPAPEWSASARPTGASYRVILPVRPEVKLGAYADYPFGITIDEITTPTSTRSSSSCAISRRRSCPSRTAARRPTTTP